MEWVFLVEKAQRRDNDLCPPLCLGKNCPPALTLMSDTSILPCMPLVPFNLLPQCWSSEGGSLSKSMFQFFKGNCLGGLQQFLPLTQSPLVIAARSHEDLSSWHWNTGTLVWASCCGDETLCSWGIPPEFLSTTCGYGTSPFCVSAPPTSLDECGFFNSVVVRHPFNSISDG